MTTAHNTSACPVLTGPNNFQIWKLQIISKLRWEKDHISDALLMKTGDLTSSKELFDKLVSLYQTSNIALAFYSFQQLTKLSWDGTSPIQDHIAKIRTIDSHLSRMKLGVDTKLMAFALLQSLPCTPEWQILQSLTWITAEVARQSGKAPGGSESALKSNEKWCDFHKAKSHNTSECRTLQSAEKGQRKKEKERYKDKGKEKEKANTAEQSS
ncbi:hypothetical protein SERLA73DRAFT_68260 [Serpula lacrymans var. lacrymans S7.3]|uniref:Uncharacterized protein n=1 Tax=Serpula lacrymans var. lacrymans (strain S7.3) TaxID=936435 RepID=F8PHU4_SERL3|nr:hypothetical protein SERLA73DRAFT_68260 [Serpula lacrymans var. lacrymans S7.3]